MTRLRIGTRGSALALTQTGLVAADITRLAGWPDDAVELVRVRTDGDRLTGSLAAIGGAGVFVTALREAVLDGRCDVAVHSLKDLPTLPADGLVVAAVPEREDPRDALCARDGSTLHALPHGARVGTGSPRRAAQLRAVRPDLEVLDIRGNVDTRLARVAPDGDLDAVVLAAAGLARLGRLDAATELLDPVVVAPAPGQGALAVECRVTPDGSAASPAGADDDLERALAALDHLPTRLAVTAERELLTTLEAGCAAPIGTLGHLTDDRLTLDAVVCRPDGGAQIRASASVRLAGDRERQIDAARALGARVAGELLAAGAADLADLRSAASTPPQPVAPGAPAPSSGGGLAVPRQALAGWRVLVPRGGEWGHHVVDLLRDHGGTATVVPLISFVPPEDPAPVDAALATLAAGAYTWVAVTSATTVTHLVDREPALARLLSTARVAAVGPGTAAALERIGVTADLVPDGDRSARGLVAAFPAPGADGLRVLLPHSDIAEATVVDGLGVLGWTVDSVVAYRTVPGPPPDPAVRTALTEGGFGAVLLTSASTVTGLLSLVGAPAASTVVCCIGPRTEQAALSRGLAVHVVAPTPSAEALVQALVHHAQRNPR